MSSHKYSIFLVFYISIVSKRKYVKIIDSQCYIGDVWTRYQVSSALGHMNEMTVSSEIIHLLKISSNHMLSIISISIRDPVLCNQEPFKIDWTMGNAKGIRSARERAEGDLQRP